MATENTTATNSTIRREGLRTANAGFAQKQQLFLDDVRRQSNAVESGEESDGDVIVLGDDSDQDADFEVGSPKAKPKKQNSNIEAKAHELCCWSCHKERPAEKVRCVTCAHVYHYPCAKVKPGKEDLKFRCNDCIEFGDAKKQDPAVFNRMLSYMMKKILDSVKNKEKFQNLIAKKNYPRHLKYGIDLKVLAKNVKSSKYKSDKSFLLDITWLQHIYHVYFPKNTAALNDIRHLYKFCKTELFNIDTCADCFVASSKKNPKWFTMVCPNPHLLIWAKLSGWPYWPAKLMSVLDKVLTVQFFGKHERAFIPAKDCLLFSRENPNNNKTDMDDENSDFFKSLEEASEYAKNLSSTYGQFSYAKANTPFQPEHYRNYIDEMIDDPTTDHDDDLRASEIFLSPIGDDSVSERVDYRPSSIEMEIEPIDPFQSHPSQMDPLAPSPTEPIASTSANFFSSTQSNGAVRPQKRKQSYSSFDYRTKHAKIIENPGVLVLRRIEPPYGQDEPQRTEHDTYISPETTDRPSERSIELRISPFAYEYVNETGTGAQSAAPSVIGSDATREMTFMTEVERGDRERLCLDMLNRIPVMVRAAKDKFASFLHDMDSIYNYAIEVVDRSASLDRTHIKKNPQCLSCGGPARLFATWSTGYCDHACRLSYHKRSGDMHYDEAI